MGVLCFERTLQPLISLSDYDNLLFEVIQIVPLLLQVLRVAVANPFFRGSQDKATPRSSQDPPMLCVCCKRRRGNPLYMMAKLVRDEGE